MKINKLKAKMTETGLTQRDLAKKMQLSKNTINNKVNGIVQFNLDEAKILAKLLQMSDEECIDIFLS